MVRRWVHEMLSRKRESRAIANQKVSSMYKCTCTVHCGENWRIFQDAAE
jgi:hypothetical protein